ncbi:flagellar basal-body rod protein FlgF [Dendrosporobacter sp. 1207_IL3150]|uniref:flagellar basal-body rod protein FlgF n=1 Tax=Dendrosporobacter sp. 1207_IL3150 TaxID=3084054 RepID=UPI002FD8E78C
MIRGLYTAASGMVAESIRTDATANNLANVNTAGFKKDTAVNKEFGEMLLHRINDGADASTVGYLGRGTFVDEVATIHTQGSMRHTGNDFDLAINGKGFFAVETDAGVRYTRNGTFSKNIVGELITNEGHKVLGQNGPIRINGNKFTVGEDGRVLVDGVESGRLQVVEFENEKQLVKEGASLYSAGENQERPASGLISQGYTEGSNVNVISEMINLINGYRAYETNAKTVQSQDQMLEKAVTEVGRV